MKRFLFWLRTHRYAWWSLLVLYILFLYFLAEILVTTDYHATELPIDDRIPFFAPAVSAYVLWYPMLVGTGLWLLIRDGRGFRDFMWFLTVCFTLSTAVYLLWPNGQDLRPDLSEPANVFEWVLSGLYAFDTNTNVFPSLHVSGALGAARLLCASPTTRKTGVRPAAVVLAALIIASTVLVKQHAAIDALGGLLTGGVSLLAVRLLRRMIDEKALRDPAREELKK